jgi:hypothetical protein
MRPAAQDLIEVVKRGKMLSFFLFHTIILIGKIEEAVSEGNYCVAGYDPGRKTNMSHVMIVIIALIAAVFLAVICLKLLMGIVSLAIWLAIVAVKIGLFVLIAGIIFAFIYGMLKRKMNT